MQGSIPVARLLQKRLAGRSGRPSEGGFEKRLFFNSSRVHDLSAVFNHQCVKRLKMRKNFVDFMRVDLCPH